MIISCHVSKGEDAAAPANLDLPTSCFPLRFFPGIPGPHRIECRRLLRVFPVDFSSEFLFLFPTLTGGGANWRWQLTPPWIFPGGIFDYLCSYFRFWWRLSPHFCRFAPNFWKHNNKMLKFFSILIIKPFEKILFQTFLVSPNCHSWSKTKPRHRQQWRENGFSPTCEGRECETLHLERFLEAGERCRLMGLKNFFFSPSCHPKFERGNLSNHLY